MNRKKFAIYAINVLLLLIWVGLIGVTLWPLSALYGTRIDWWGGNSAMDATKYVVWGPLAGMLGLGVHLHLLQKRRKTPKNPDIVPLLVFHGTADSVVAVTQSQELNAMCDARGRKCVYIEIPRGEHCFEGDSNSGPSQITLWAMERFMMLCRS